MSDKPTGPERCPGCGEAIHVWREQFTQYTCETWAGMGESNQCLRNQRDRLRADLDQMRDALQLIVECSNAAQRNSAVREAEALLRAGEPKL